MVGEDLAPRKKRLTPITEIPTSEISPFIDRSISQIMEDTAIQPSEREKTDGGKRDEPTDANSDETDKEPPSTDDSTSSIKVLWASDPDLYRRLGLENKEKTPSDDISIVVSFGEAAPSPVLQERMVMFAEKEEENETSREISLVDLVTPEMEEGAVEKTKEAISTVDLVTPESRSNEEASSPVERTPNSSDYILISRDVAKDKSSFSFAWSCHSSADSFCRPGYTNDSESFNYEVASSAVASPSARKTPTLAELEEKAKKILKMLAREGEELEKMRKSTEKIMAKVGWLGEMLDGMIAKVDEVEVAVDRLHGYSYV